METDRIYIYIERETDRQTDRQTDRKGGREGERERERERERGKERERERERKGEKEGEGREGERVKMRDLMQLLSVPLMLTNEGNGVRPIHNPHHRVHENNVEPHVLRHHQIHYLRTIGEGRAIEAFALEGA